MTMQTIKVKPGTPQKMDETDTSTFEEWMGKVDHVLNYVFGITHDDLPDCTWRDWYDNRVRPIRAANRALRNAQE